MENLDDFKKKELAKNCIDEFGDTLYKKEIHSPSKDIKIPYCTILSGKIKEACPYQHVQNYIRINYNIVNMATGNIEKLILDHPVCCYEQIEQKKEEKEYYSG